MEDHTYARAPDGSDKADHPFYTGQVSMFLQHHASFPPGTDPPPILHLHPGSTALLDDDNAPQTPPPPETPVADRFIQAHLSCGAVGDLFYRATQPLLSQDTFNPETYQAINGVYKLGGCSHSDAGRVAQVANDLFGALLRMQGPQEAFAAGGVPPPQSLSHPYQGEAPTQAKVPIIGLVAYGKEHNEEETPHFLRSLFMHRHMPLKLIVFGDTTGLQTLTHVMLRMLTRPEGELGPGVPESFYKFPEDDITLINMDRLRYWKHLFGYIHPQTKQRHPRLFIKLFTHELLPHISKIIMMDSDLLVMDDISNLWEEFDHFKPGNLVGMAIDQSRGYYYRCVWLMCVVVVMTRSTAPVGAVPCSLLPCLLHHFSP